MAKIYEDKKVVKITFENQKAAENFALWLCEMGEQDYWQWMENREFDQKGNITATSFDYWSGTKNGRKFDWSDIKATCGRLDKK